MRSQPVSFFTEHQLRLDGDLYLPDEAAPAGGFPGIVSCSGYQGLKDIHPARFARVMVERGYACLAFDYRGFGASEGERGRLIPQEQVEDVRCAVSFMEGHDEVDASCISMIGWALGGSVAIAEVADDPRVKALVACNAMGDCGRSTRTQHTDTTWSAINEKIECDRIERAHNGGRSQVVHPFDIVRLDEVTRGYVDTELYKNQGFGSWVSLESADALLRFRPEDTIDRIAPRPIMLVHGADNGLYLPAESQHLFDRAGEPRRIELLEGSGHTEWMFDEHPTFQKVATMVGEFLDDARAADREMSVSGGASA